MDNLEELPAPDQLSSEDQIKRVIIRSVATVAAVVVIAFGGCTAHSNTFDAERLAEEANITAEETKASIAKSQAKQAEIEAMERMVKDGANPVAVRCMMEGWNNSSTTCLSIGLALGEITNGND